VPSNNTSPGVIVYVGYIGSLYGVGVLSDIMRGEPREAEHTGERAMSMNTEEQEQNVHGLPRGQESGEATPAFLKTAMAARAAEGLGLLALKEARRFRKDAGFKVSDIASRRTVAQVGATNAPRDWTTGSAYAAEDVSRSLAAAGITVSPTTVQRAAATVRRIEKVGEAYRPAKATRDSGLGPQTFPEATDAADMVTDALAALAVIEQAERDAETAARRAAVRDGFDAMEVAMADNATDAMHTFSLKASDFVPVVNVPAGFRRGEYSALETVRTIKADGQDEDADTGLNLTAGTIAHLRVDHGTYCPTCRKEAHALGLKSSHFTHNGPRAIAEHRARCDAPTVPGGVFTIGMPHVMGTLDTDGAPRGVVRTDAYGEVRPVRVRVSAKVGRAMLAAQSTADGWKTDECMAATRGLVQQGLKVRGVDGDTFHNQEVMPVMFCTDTAEFIGLAVVSPNVRTGSNAAKFNHA
jgi:hypothetical protein